MSGKIGNLDPYGLEFLFNSSVARVAQQSDDNTFSDVVNGEGKNYAITPFNFTTGEGYKYNNGAPYYEVPGVNEYYNITGFGDIQNAVELTIEQVVSMDDFSSTHYSLYTVGYNILYTNASGWIIFSFGANYAYIPRGTVGDNRADVSLIWIYNGAGATNSDKLKLLINGVETSLAFVGTIPSSLPTIAHMRVSNSSSAIKGNHKQTSVWNYAMSINQANYLYQLGAGLGGLIGVQPDTPDGTMSLIDNRIGLKNDYQLGVSLNASANPSTTDYSTGNAPVKLGEQAQGSGAAVLDGAEFIAESGGVDAHYLFDSITDKINIGALPFLNNATELTIIQRLFVDDKTATQAFTSCNLDATHDIRASLNGGHLFISFINGAQSGYGQVIDFADNINNGEYFTLSYVYDTKYPTKLPLVIVNQLVLPVLIVGTLPDLLPDFEDSPFIIGEFEDGTRNSFFGKYLCCDIYPEAKSENFIKSQYYANSDGRWGSAINFGGIYGVPTAVNGIIDYRCKYQAFSAQMVWLQKESSVIIQHEWGTGKIGNGPRSYYISTDETLARFDLSNLIGERIASLRLFSFINDVSGSGTGDVVYCSAQNKTSLVGVSAAPKYDDFSSTAWSETLTSAAGMRITGPYEYNQSSAINEYFQSILSEEESQDNGIVFDGLAYGLVAQQFSVELLIQIKTGILPPPYILKQN